MNNFKSLLLFAAVFLIPLNALAEVSNLNEIPSDYFSCTSTPTLTGADKIIVKVQNAYNKVSGLTSHFRQKSSLLGMPEGFFSGGELKFLRPGKMSWIYKTPKPQSFISNGEIVWFYEPTVNQVTVLKLAKSFDTQIPVSFLLGVGELNNSFSPENICQIGEFTLLNLKPKKDEGNLKSFALLVDSKTYLPAGAKMTDVADTVTEFVFDNLNIENNIDPKDFMFIPPDGVDIIKQ